MSKRRDEVEAAVDALVGHHFAVDLRFSVQILVVLRFDVFDDRLPADGVTSPETSIELGERTRSEHEAKQMRQTNQLLLSTASPKPGVSTMRRRNSTPPSRNATCVVSTCNTHRLSQMHTVLLHMGLVPSVLRYTVDGPGQSS